MSHLTQAVPVPKLRPALAASLALLLAGCGGNASKPVTDPPVPPPTTGYAGTAISGVVLAGTKPLAGSSVQLYAAGTTGNGSAPTALSSAATSDSSGAFNLPSGYTCPSASSQLYFVARNGAVAPAPNNSAIALALALGRCDALTASTKYVANEVTTAATVWALSQFLSAGGTIGATSTNSTGLSNAVATSLSLAGSTTGTSPGPGYPSTGSAPAPRINLVANLLNTCTSAASSCTRLFTLTTPSSGTSPTNTLDAALNLVRSPAANVSGLFALAQTSTAFSPALTSVPADWTLPLTFKGGGLNEPGPLAIDSNGNVWVAGYPGVASRFSTTGAPIFPSGITGFGLSESYGLAIDLSDNVWITDENSPAVNSNFGAVTVLNSAGQPLSGANGFSLGGLNYPVAVAIDPNGTAWVVDYGNSHLTQLSSSGQPLSGAAGYTSDLFAFPVAIALDAAHNAWVANMSGNSITRVSPDGKQFTGVQCCDGASGLALDASGNVWVANYLGDSVSQVPTSGAAAFTAYIAPSINHPQGIAIDGAGNVWVASFRGNSVTELAGATSARPGQTLSPAAVGWAPTPTSLQAFSLAIDASGNVWISNFADNSITKIVGLAAPIKTPLSALPKTP